MSIQLEKDSGHSEIKVLIPFVGDTIGGSHISALELFAQLSRMRDISPQIALMEDGPLAIHLADLGVTYRKFPKPRGDLSVGVRQGLLLSVASSLRLAKWLRDEKIDVVHTHDFRMHVLWSVACRFSRARHMLHLRSPTRRSRSFTILAILATKIVTVSNFCRDYIGGRIAGEMLVVPNPVNIVSELNERQKTRERLLRRVSGGRTSVLIGWSGNYWERKRPQDFVELATKMSKISDSDIRFLMFGNHKTRIGEGVEKLICDRGLGERVFMLGWEPHFVRLLPALDLFISTSEEESFGRTLVEALLAGTPVIASDIPPHTESLREGAFGTLYPCGDVEKLFERTLEHVLDPRQNLEKAREAYPVLKEAHEPYQHAARIRSIYFEMIS